MSIQTLVKPMLGAATQFLRAEFHAAYENHPQLTRLSFLSLAGAMGVLIAVSAFRLSQTSDGKVAATRTVAQPASLKVAPATLAPAITDKTPVAHQSHASGKADLALGRRQAEAAAEAARQQAQAA